MNSSSSRDRSCYLTILLWLSPWRSERNGQWPFPSGCMDSRIKCFLNNVKRVLFLDYYLFPPFPFLQQNSTSSSVTKKKCLYGNGHAFQHAVEHFPKKWGHQKHRAEKSQMALIFDFILSSLIFSRWIGRLTLLTLLQHCLLLQLPLWMFFHKASPGTSEIDAWSPACVMLHYANVVESCCVL